MDCFPGLVYIKIGEMRLSIIIPVYNEEKTLAEIIRKVKKTNLSGIKKEIIVVDDGSTDKTSQVVKNLRGVVKVSYRQNRGKGYAIRQGLKKASGDYVLIQDADLEYDPEDYQELVRPILKNQAEVVYGSRFLGPHKNMFFYNMVANKLLSLLTNILYNSTLSDMEVGYKLFPRQLLKSLELRENGFGFEPEATAKILKKRIRIYEVPISYSGREIKEGKKITWKDGVRAVWVLLKYRLFD